MLDRRTTHRPLWVTALVGCLALAACSSSSASAPSSTTAGTATADTTVRLDPTTPPTTAPPTTAPPTTAPPTSTTTASTTTSTTPPASATTSTTSPASTTTPSTTTPSTTTTPISVGGIGTTLPPQPLALPAVEAAAENLGRRNRAASVSVWRDDRAVFHRAYGTTNSGAPVDHTTEFVQASVSKLITALTVVRLVQRGDISLTDPVPWDDMNVAHHPGWDTVTIAELMGHVSGMPIAADAWFDSRGPCNDPLGYLVAIPPQAFRGKWTYSNGNYCALGLLVEHLTGMRYDDAARALVLAPAGVSEGHITVDGAEPDDAPYPLGVGRLDRLGGAGQWVMSPDQVAAVLSTVTPEDLALLTGPGIFFDPFGWGHTGTVDGAKSCAWTVEDGRTVIVATIAGNDPGKGSWVCAVVLPALVTDLGLVPNGPDIPEGQVPSTTVP